MQSLCNCRLSLRLGRSGSRSSLERGRWSRTTEFHRHVMSGLTVCQHCGPPRTGWVAYGLGPRRGGRWHETALSTMARRVSGPGFATAAAQYGCPGVAPARPSEPLSVAPLRTVWWPLGQPGAGVRPGARAAAVGETRSERGGRVEPASARGDGLPRVGMRDSQALTREP